MKLTQTVRTFSCLPLIENHYPARPDSLNDMCLYDFVKHIDWNHRNNKNEKTFRRLQKPRVPNHPLFDPERPDQTDHYYYSLVLMFVPFRDEGELLLPDETPEQHPLDHHHGNPNLPNPYPGVKMQPPLVNRV